VVTRPSAADRAAVVYGLLAAFLMIAQQIAGKSARDALFLSSFPATELPKVMIVAAGISIVAVLAMSRSLARFGPTRIVPFAFFASGVLFAVEWWLAPQMKAVVAWLVYLHIAAFGSIVISGFWSVINERFDPHAAKRHVARIATGSTLGGVVGGVAAERIAAIYDVRTSLLVLCVFNLLAGFLVMRVGSGAPRRTTAEVERRNGVQIIKETPYLQQLGILVALIAASATLIDYAFKAEAAAQFTDEASLMRFFALFYTVTAFLTFVAQSAFGAKALQKLGLDGTIALLPAAVVIFGTLGAAVQQFFSVVLVRAVEGVFSNSFARSGYELLYTPVSTEKKRPTKTIIDVASNRLGDAIGSVITLGVLAIAAPFAPTIVIVLAVVASVGALWFTRRLHGGYVDALAESLKSGALHLESSDVVDATTQRTLTETTMALDREKLLEQIQVLRESQGHSEPPPSVRPGALPPAPRDSSPHAPEHGQTAASALAVAADDLSSGDPARITPHLATPDPRLTTLLIPLIGRRDLYPEVLRALRDSAPRVTGQLIDALLDPAQPFVVRRRLPRVLAEVHDDRAIAGLFLGLGDARFEVRYQCGRALRKLVKGPESPQVTKARVFEAVLRELEVGKSVWEGHRLLDEDSIVGDEDSMDGWLDGVVRDRLHRSLEHVFTLLALVLERETLHLSLKALNSNDTTLRGTALEYLENVLPDDIRKKLWPYLGQRDRVAAMGSRPKQQIVEDLLRSMDGVPVDPEALRRKRD